VVKESKWKRGLKAEEDKNQAMLSTNPSMTVQLRHPPSREVKVDFAKSYACPFCLYQAEVAKFLISTGKGFHKGLVKCPDCRNRMQFKTLIAEMTPEEFAEWCWDYVSLGFWKKVSFAKFRERLWRAGWSRRFWGRYYELRGEGEEE